jgi:hypothetical protein
MRNAKLLNKLLIDLFHYLGTIADHLIFDQYMATQSIDARSYRPQMHIVNIPYASYLFQPIADPHHIKVSGDCL